MEASNHPDSHPGSLSAASSVLCGAKWGSGANVQRLTNPLIPTSPSEAMTGNGGDCRPPSKTIICATHDQIKRKSEVKMNGCVGRDRGILEVSSWSTGSLVLCRDDLSICKRIISRNLAAKPLPNLSTLSLYSSTFKL